MDNAGKFYKLLPADKIKINGNKAPIPMKLFLSFLTVKTQQQSDFLGSCTGWTQYTGDNRLIITGGIVGGTNYLDHILYGKNLNNQYNNFVNPFYLFDIMNEEGKKFFLEYYAAEIAGLKTEAENRTRRAKEELSRAKKYKDELFSFWEELVP